MLVTAASPVSSAVLSHLGVSGDVSVFGGFLVRPVFIFGAVAVTGVG